MLEKPIKKQRTCEFCNKSLNKRFVKFTNIEQDIPTHYFCNNKCKFNWLNIQKNLLDWCPIDQEYVDGIFNIIRRCKKTYKLIKKKNKKLKKIVKNKFK